jgi:hypothetical protein
LNIHLLNHLRILNYSKLVLQPWLHSETLPAAQGHALVLCLDDYPSVKHHEEIVFLRMIMPTATIACLQLQIVSRVSGVSKQLPPLAPNLMLPSHDFYLLGGGSVTSTPNLS